MKQTSDTSFEPDWLGLREPADIAARDAGLLARAGALAAGGGVVLDLGAGTGSTARAFAAVGISEANWRFVDQDPGLLHAAQASCPDAECVLADLAQVDDLPMEGVSLITASALLDLMSEHWVKGLFDRATALRLPIYSALNYNGAMRWAPSDARDADITAAFNIHQQTDKGTGPALGPAAAKTLAGIARAAGWQVATAQSDWWLEAEHAALQVALVAGIAAAAHEAGAPDAQAWGADRRALANKALAVIGHDDILVIPGDTEKCA